MANWNKKLGLGILLNLGLLMTTPNPASASDCSPCGDPCAVSDSCSDSCFGGLEISADFLYWKPCVDDLTFGARISPASINTITGVVERDIDYKNICPKWTPGFRLAVAKEDIWCGMKALASYTWISSEDSSSLCGSCGTDLPGWIESPLLHPAVQGSAPKQYAKGRWDSTYHNWDILLAFEVCGSRCHSFEPFFGISGLTIDQEVCVSTYDDVCSPNVNALHMAWENDFFGVGFKVGSNYTYQLCDGFNLFAFASGTIVSGSADNKFNRNVQTINNEDGELATRYNFYDDPSCQLVPGYHLGLGVSYESEMCGCTSNLHIGWEYVAWHNVSNPRRFSEAGVLGGTTLRDSSYSSQANTSTYGFHGLSVGVDLTF